MGFLDIFKSKKETNNDDKEPKVYYGFEANGKYVHVNCPTVVNKANGMELYVCNICETDREEDTMFFDRTRPVAFELPEGRADLIVTLINTWYQNRTNKELAEFMHTFIGDIKPGPNGKLYYYNEGASKESREKLNELDAKLIETERQKEKDRMQQAIKRKEEQFREQLKIEEFEAKKYEASLKEKQERIKNAYFKSVDNRENYDLTNTENGNILLIRGIKKYKDPSGRYLYKAKINEVPHEDYTEFSEPIGYDVTFTVPGRLYDIVNDANNPQCKLIKKNLQTLLSHSYGVLEKNRVNQCVDLGGISQDGQSFSSNKNIGILYSKILEIGARSSIEDLESRKR